jgi:hypothetical protein
MWRLPWHRARMDFECRYDQETERYATFKVRTRSRWAPAELAIEDSGKPPAQLAGISNLESALVLLTHPLRGYFVRRDGALGSYAIWHDRARLTVGTAPVARYPLLQQLGLVEEGVQSDIHSVLIQPSIDFTIYLPPSKIDTRISPVGSS